MNKVKILLTAGIISFATSILAQEGEPGGIWASAGVSKEITKKWSADVEFEFRTLDFTTKRERFAFQIGTDYELIKNLKLGVGYSYLNVYDDFTLSPGNYYQNRNRFYGQLGYKLKFGNFSLSFRERAQLTYKNDSDRINIYGVLNTNRINPDLIWRNKIKLAYNIKKNPFTPYISFESYYLTNDPSAIRDYNADLTEYTEVSSYFNKLRYSAGVEYEITKKHSIDLFGMYSMERGAEEVKVSGPNYYQLSAWNNTFVLGIGYTYSF
jgi:opacity protein-like surface antigen